MAFPGFLDFTRPGKGADSEENCPGFILFFRRYWRHFSKLLFANLVCAFVSLPAYVWLTGIINVNAIEKTGGVISVLGSVVLAIVIDWPQWLLIFLVVLSVVLSGPVKAALSLCALNCAWGIPGMFWSNFRIALKENWKQALPIGLFDTVAEFASIYYFIDGQVSFGSCFGVLIIAWTAFCFLYLLAHVYFFPVMVTIELSFFSLIKNCFILSLLQVWRSLIVVALFVALLFSCLWADILVFPCFFYSLVLYAAAFLTRPVIEKYLMPADDEVSGIS